MWQWSNAHLSGDIRLLVASLISMSVAMSPFLAPKLVQWRRASSQSNIEAFTNPLAPSLSG